MNRPPLGAPIWAPIRAPIWAPTLTGAPNHDATAHGCVDFAPCGERDNPGKTK
jgi:hypothetical protein